MLPTFHMSAGNPRQAGKSRVIHLLTIVALLALWALPLWSSVSTVPTASAQSGEDLPMPVAPFGTHPRLLITQTTVDEVLKPRAASNVPAWGLLSDYVNSGDPEEDAEWAADSALRSLAVAWLVTGDLRYAERAKRVMAGLINRIEAHPVMQGSEGGIDGQLLEDVAALAVGFDWMYHALTTDDRANVQDTLWRASKRLRDPEADIDGIIWVNGQLSAFGNYDARWLWALTATALALWGEHENAPALMDFCREVLTGTVIPALDLQQGGAWAEGPVYGFIAVWPKVQTALAWWTAAGENYFAATRWWYDRLAYDLFLYHPSNTTTYNAEWGEPMHSYPSIIGDSERYHPAVAYGRAQDLLLAAVFRGFEYANWMAWFLRQPPDSLPRWMAIEEFLWRDPLWLGAPPTLTTWVAPYNGHVFMRSHWINDQGRLDPSATYVSFNAGDHLAYHQFFDQGNFTIFHDGADLVVRSGVYSGDGTSDHDANYYVRSIAANTLLICDLAETFDGIRPNSEREVWFNDCGQRSLRPASRTAVNVDVLMENWRAYDTGSITRLGELNAASGAATYIRADLTGAYNSTLYTTPDNRAKVSSVIRELVYVRPGTVVVADRIVTTYPTYAPFAIFHFQTKPAPNGIFYGTLVNDSALYMQNLLPNSTVRLVEGFEVAGQMIDQSWGEPASNTFEIDPYGYFRLEIAPSAPNLDYWFLTVFHAQNAGDPPPAEGVLVPGDQLRGVILGDTQVMFDLTPDDARDVTEGRFQVGTDVQTLLITGLQPDTVYRVTAGGNAGGSYAANAAGMLALVGLPPGMITISREP